MTNWKYFQFTQNFQFADYFQFVLSFPIYPEFPICYKFPICLLFSVCSISNLPEISNLSLVPFYLFWRMTVDYIYCEFQLRVSHYEFRLHFLGFRLNKRSNNGFYSTPSVKNALPWLLRYA